MKKFFVLMMVAVTSLALVGCEYDDSAIWGKVDELEKQVQDNSEDIAALSALVDALNQGKVITSTEQTEDGYTLTFNDGSTVEVKNGQDGDSFFTSIEEKDGMVIITLADGRVIKIPAIDYDLRVLTFEDAAYKGSASNAATYWSDLIADSEYGNGNGRNAWWDEDNTELSFTPSATALFPGYGGHAVSNYVGDDLSQGDYMHDLQAYAVDGGANGSKNFCVHFGYIDDSGMGMMSELIGFEFEDGAERVIDHMWVTNTTYVYNILANGDGWMVPAGGVSDNCWLKIVADGYDADGNKTGSAEFKLWDEGRKGVKEWTKWNLASLGEVARVEFNLIGSEELYESGYGLGAPGYFAYDDVAVRFKK